MSFAEVLQELPSLTVSEHQLLVRRALDLDEPGLSQMKRWWKNVSPRIIKILRPACLWPQ
jgi:hypothetical protein